MMFPSATAKAFGVTDLLNPNDYNEPIAQVYFSSSQIKLVHICNYIFNSASMSNHLQVIKRMTDGGADFAFECIGDTGMISTALQSCCDVIL